MMLKKIYFLLALMLLLAAIGCAPADLPATPVQEPAQTAVTATPPAALEIVTATFTPIITPTQPAATDTPTTPPEQPTATSTPAHTPEPLSDSETAQIYATAVRQIYTVDHTFGGDPPEFSFVYIVTTTDDGSMLYEPKTAPQQLTAELQAAITAQLTDLPFETFWIASLDEAPVDPNNGRIAGGQGIVITLGNILPQNDGTLHLPVFMVCGGLCALGKTYELEQIDGAWQVTGSVGPEIMA